MIIRIFQRGFNYSQDGPGNRLVYHMCGCNMNCPWCANPECNGPGGKDMDAELLIDEVLRSKSMFFDNGGVTFTGGEPTIQYDVLKYVLDSLHHFGIDTTIETNASHPGLPALFGSIDHLIMDFKHPNPQKHKEITGISQDIILDNIKKACLSHPHVLIRTPLINGYNASTEDMYAFAHFFLKISGANVSFEPLWYHEYGKNKWKQLQKPYTIDNGFLSDAKKQEYLDILRAHNLTVIRT